jgi:hypothetical protein
MEASVSSSLSPALELCRGLLAYTDPGTAVPVPHAALAELVELATGSIGTHAVNLEAPELPRLHDVAALGRRYNRARATVRQWFHDGRFGPPEQRLFRGRGYVASDDVVREFERRTGLRPVSGEPVLARDDFSRQGDMVVPARETPVQAGTRSARDSKVVAAGRGVPVQAKRQFEIGSKIATAAGRSLRPALR